MQTESPRRASARTHGAWERSNLFLRRSLLPLLGDHAFLKAPHTRSRLSARRWFARLLSLAQEVDLRDHAFRSRRRRLGRRLSEGGFAFVGVWCCGHYTQLFFFLCCAVVVAVGHLVGSSFLELVRMCWCWWVVTLIAVFLADRSSFSAWLLAKGIREWNSHKSCSFRVIPVWSSIKWKINKNHFKYHATVWRKTLSECLWRHVIPQAIVLKIFVWILCFCFFFLHILYATPFAT